ncbi:putative Ring canal kelch protein [Hypsibius exemplaris]|uniref:Ring canal kelch protein n=1 Tax=Hypsibius exemplaris TaxID=2072580 RepID=A0A1W0WR41_HYPEX|nr:putative Ring canal kelch protein [Hypsibius exemplaris]
MNSPATHKRRSDGVSDQPTKDIIARVSSISLPDLPDINKSGVITNRIPDVILPEEIPTARLILRRDRRTHFEDLGAVVDRMRKDDKGHDCVVVCGKEKMNAHRSVLVAHSEYFQKLLFDTGDKLMVDVPTDGIPTRGMAAIIDYMYTGELKINYENAVETLTTANILQMPQLTDRCSDFIGTLLADENLMTTLELAERTGVNPLYAEAYKRLARNFYVQTKMPGFLLWDIEKVCRLLSNDHIVIETEVHVFTSAMRWMQFKEAERRQHFKRLMDCVRWVYMTTEEVMKCVDQEPDLLKHSDIRILLIDANWYTTLQSYNFIWKDYIIPLPRIRSLRKEDPDEVVQRMRISLIEKHSSFDHVWKPRDPANDSNSPKTGTERKFTPAFVPEKSPRHQLPSLHIPDALKSPKSAKSSRRESNPEWPKAKIEPRHTSKSRKPPEEESRKKSPRGGERFSIFRKVAKTVHARQISQSDASTHEAEGFTQKVPAKSGKKSLG